MIVALPAQALEIENLDESGRAALRAEIRAYLLENPEVIMEAVAVLEEREAAGQAAADVDLVRANADALFNSPGDWVGGNPDGDITLVEFMDYRCSFCRRAVPEVEGLLATDGNIRLILKEFPILGEESVAASRFAIATKIVAGDDAYKSVHDALMSYTGSMNTAGFTRLADALGLDASAIVAEMDNDAVTAVIAANHALAQRLRISGTPSFVMGEHMLRGYLPQAQMQAIADEIRTN
ncbi:DsbA family protein [Roseovarius autotrophicus]|uniref:DsbA family protein n=1 Tax=Roseovarius autotrophicus TaxID=2824121 RepID=UPI0019F2EF1A|nr:DsbA family protein [Roseovarius autotrophicus]MBE0454201.1 DsbA family protein [Roseovarius sp.]